MVLMVGIVLTGGRKRKEREKEKSERDKERLLELKA